MMQVKPELEEIRSRTFKRKYFRPFTVGLQIRYTTFTSLVSPTLHCII